MTNKQSYKFSISILLVVVLVDQITKTLFTNSYYQVIPNILSVFYNENTGAAWTIFEGKVEILAVLSMVFLLTLVVFNYHFKEKTRLYMISYGLIIGGAVGNLIDRVFFGYVRDFIKLDFVRFPIFNIADTALTVGMICLSVFILFVIQKLKAKTVKGRKNEF